MVSGREIVGVRHFHDQVRLPHLPIRDRRWRGTESRGIALHSPLLDPPPDRLDLGAAQPPLADEAAVPGLRQPWRHDAFRRHLGNPLRPRLHVVVRQQRERRDLPRPMAGTAPLHDDRSHMPGERDGIAGDRRAIAPAEGSGTKEQDGKKMAGGQGSSSSALYDFCAAGGPDNRAGGGSGARASGPMGSARPRCWRRPKPPPARYLRT
jgi:hypothetical protein